MLSSLIRDLLFANHLISCAAAATLPTSWVIMSFRRLRSIWHPSTLILGTFGIACPLLVRRLMSLFCLGLGFGGIISNPDLFGEEI